MKSEKKSTYWETVERANIYKKQNNIESCDIDMVDKNLEQRSIFNIK